MLNRYAFTHIIIVDGGGLKKITVLGFFRKKSAEKKLQETLRSLIGHGNDNLYYTALIEEKNGKKVVTRDVTHHIAVEKI